MRDALERETSGSILDPSKSIDRNRTHHRQHDGDQHCAPQNSLSNPNPGLRQRNDFRAEDKVNSSAQAKNNGVHDKPVLVSAGWLDLFAALFTRGSLQLLANFGALADFLHCVAHHDWNRTGSRNRPHAPRHFGSSKPLNLPRGNESQVCSQTRTLRSSSLNKRNARRESFRAPFVGPRAAHFYGPRKLLIL